MKLHFFLLGILISTLPLQAQEKDRISEAMENYDYEEALAMIGNKEKTIPLLFQKAQALRGLYRYKEAVICLQEIVDCEPQNQKALIELAEAYKLSGKFHQALLHYEKVLGLNPANKFVRLQRVNLLYLLEKYEASLEACDHILKEDSLLSIIRLKAQCHEALLQVLSAATCYASAITKDPTDYISVSKFANLMIGSEKYDDAIQLTEYFRKTDSTNIFVNRQNAQAYCLKQDYETAINRYKYLVDNGDLSQLTCYYLGMSYFALELYYEAHDYLKIAYAYNPLNINLLYYFGRACARTSWKKEGIGYLQDAINLSIPEDADLAKLYAGLAECYFRDDDRKNQVEALKMQLKYEADKNILLYRIGVIYDELLDDQNNAEKYLGMFVKTKPKDMVITEGFDPKSDTNKEKAYYYYADIRLKRIRDERFFRDGIKQE